MEAKRRYTTMVFPQGFDGDKLSLNIVLIPRNQDPNKPFATSLPVPNDMAAAFAELEPQFEIGITQGLGEWPLSNATAPNRVPIKKGVAVAKAVNKKALFTALGAQFATQLALDNTTDKAEPVVSEEVSVKKYLPFSYRQAFNFTSPRHPNAVTDDSYHCALRKVTPKVVKPNDDRISWGQLYANILRQPLLAEACGMIYKAEVSVSENPDLFKKGCYIYADIVNPDYAFIQEKYLEMPDGPFIKRYAARIPQLELGTARPVFAPMLFPVLYQRSGQPEPVPLGEWDKIFAEVNEYNEGFARVVHAMQPVSVNMLAEEHDGTPPQKDAGIRLAWDDEQILIWYVRQLAANPADPANGRVDAPLGVFGYAVDVRNSGENDDDWSSLNLVASNAEKSDAYKIQGTDTGIDGDQQVELPYQVFPTQQEAGDAYWLPMYYTAWTGKSLVLKDEDAIAIYQNDKALDERTKMPKQVTRANAFDEVAAKAKLLYGKSYDFRVRLRDISGGGPTVKERSEQEGITTIPFRRYIAPDACRITNTPIDLAEATIEFFNETAGGFDAAPTLSVQRPLLNYPAVVFTGKYQKAGQDPVKLILDSMAAQMVNPPDPIDPNKPTNVLTPGIADPDVTKVHIKVEVETLRLDNQLSQDGRENYILLYETDRTFPESFNDTLSIPVRFIDEPVLAFDDKLHPFSPVTHAAENALINATEGDLPLPTARRIRVTLRSVCDGDGSYFGFIDNGNPDKDSRYGKATRVWFYRESAVENNLLVPHETIAPLQGIYLQPDPVILNDGTVSSRILFREGTDNKPDIVKRLAEQLGVERKGLTLVGRKGQRVIFGCSNKIRHHLAPDNSSITFSSKEDLINHWIGALVYNLNRDWTWDGLQDQSFILSRKKKFRHDRDADTEVLDILGDIEVKHTASLESLQPDIYGKVKRSSSTIIFIDAIEPKTALQGHGGHLRFPDELLVKYSIKPKLKPGHGSGGLVTSIRSKTLHLPTTIIPAQVPKIVSAGIAFSPYLKNEKYSATEARQKYLWVELAEPVSDRNDTLFCRVLAYAPDQLLSNNERTLLDAPEEPLLPIDPEYIRVIQPGATDDMAGLDAMQPMEQANHSNKHYLLPIPPGLNPESPEMFGFFTYEFRIGHGHWSDRLDNLWSTAQGRFGRPLRITGMQHPAPTLLCTANRDDRYLYVSAPYAKAVWKGRNVTSDPPRTSLYCVLYAQVMQADKQEFRNILIDDKLMSPNLHFVWKDHVGVPTYTGDPKALKGHELAIYKDKVRTGTAYWTSQEIADLLVAYGLPEDSPLSVVVVETFGNITNRTQRVAQSDEYRFVAFATDNRAGNGDAVPSQKTDVTPEATMVGAVANNPRPLSNHLGNYRILRTSPLTEVPFVCCPTC